MDDLIYKLQSKLKLKITGRKVEYFLKKVMNSKIELLDIKVVNRKELIIVIYKKDYEKLLELKSIYEVDIVDYKGLLKIKKVININSLLILFSILGLFLVLFLSNVIFSVEVIHNDADLRKFLLEELKNYDIEPKKLKKDFDKIEEIKKEILEKYRDKIEWLEIENVGTKYIVRVEERKIINIEKDDTKRNVIATKSAIIKKVFATSGVIVKNTDEYVKAGDVIISGEITLNEEVQNTVKADGIVYGEVWYNIKVEYPYVYSEKKETGKKKEVYAIKFLNHTFELFNFKKFKEKIVEDKILLKHLFLPISLVKQKQKEVEIIEYVSTEEEAVMRALEKGREQMESKLDENEYIIDEKQLKVNIKESKIELDIFYAVYENITGYAEIVEEKIEEKTEEER